MNKLPRYDGELSKNRIPEPDKRQGLFADQFSYDTFHRNPENVHRIVKDFVNSDGARIPDATTPPAVTVSLQSIKAALANSVSSLRNE